MVGFDFDRRMVRKKNIVLWSMGQVCGRVVGSVKHLNMNVEDAQVEGSCIPEVGRPTWSIVDLRDLLSHGRRVFSSFLPI